MHTHGHAALPHLQGDAMNYHQPYVSTHIVCGRKVNYFVVSFVEGFSDGTQIVTEGHFCLN